VEHADEGINVDVNVEANVNVYVNVNFNVNVNFSVNVNFNVNFNVNIDVDVNVDVNGNVSVKFNITVLVNINANVIDNLAVYQVMVVVLRKRAQWLLRGTFKERPRPEICTHDLGVDDMRPAALMRKLPRPAADLHSAKSRAGKPAVWKIDGRLLGMHGGQRPGPEVS
jgi:hypothetical protein